MDAGSRAELLRVTTWNVLHRVHAVNWKEGPVLAFPDERRRIDGISARVARWLGDDVDAICLQEVSGDQLRCLRAVAGASVQVFEHTYPRVPRMRGPEPLDLDDPKEHLVTLVKGLSARQVESRTFDTDPGKGLLAVELASGVLLINTHVSFGPRGRAQLAVIYTLAQAQAGIAVIVGDFNALSDEVCAGLGGPCAISDLAGQAPTRVLTKGHGGRTIDHVVVLGGTIAVASVGEGEGLSDHLPVTATVRGWRERLGPG
jgi:endonuclease/exonuclease/phosphatase family metal-dependent hydrolase